MDPRNAHIPGQRKPYKIVRKNKINPIQTPLFLLYHSAVERRTLHAESTEH